MARKPTYFDRLWLERKEFQTWLEEVPKDKSLYRCKLCNTERKLSNMGIMALKSHIEGAKHKRLSELDKKSKTRPTSILNFLSGNNSSESSQPAVSQDMPDVSLDLVPTTSTGTIKNSFTFNADDRVKAEVLWVLNMINRTSHSSLLKTHQVFYN